MSQKFVVAPNSFSIFFRRAGLMKMKRFPKLCIFQVCTSPLGHIFRTFLHVAYVSCQGSPSSSGSLGCWASLLDLQSVWFTEGQAGWGYYLHARRSRGSWRPASLLQSHPILQVKFGRHISVVRGPIGGHAKVCGGHWINGNSWENKSLVFQL